MSGEIIPFLRRGAPALSEEQTDEYIAELHVYRNSDGGIYTISRGPYQEMEDGEEVLARALFSAAGNHGGGLAADMRDRGEDLTVGQRALAALVAIYHSGDITTWLGSCMEPLDSDAREWLRRCLDRAHDAFGEMGDSQS